MHVEEIDSIEGFEALRAHWDATFAQDRCASIFVSWAWLRGWFDVTPFPWTVLAVREHERGRYVGFLPLSVRGSRNPLRVDHFREVHMAGEPAADYTGFVCSPECEDAVLKALALHVCTKMTWEQLRFCEVNDPRLDRFLSYFPGSFRRTDREGIACPFIPLPATFEQYLEETLGYETRKSLRKRIRQVERDCSIERLNGSNGDQLIDALMQLAGGRKREDQDPHTMRLHAPLRRCVQDGTAWVVLIRKREEPVAGLGCFIDRKFNSLCTYLTSYDEKFASLSAGRVVNAICIRDAIEMGLKTLDFLRGPEPYKMQFGAAVRHNRTVWIERPTLQTRVRKRVGALRQLLQF